MIQKGSSNISEITIEQIRAARALLGWSQTELAARAELSLPTVKRVEINSDLRVSAEARLRLRVALEAGGVEFIDENGGGPGVRLSHANGALDRRIHARGRD
jgi:transcriptional regulator with XRE-family HTH domain